MIYLSAYQARQRFVGDTPPLRAGEDLEPAPNLIEGCGQLGQCQSAWISRQVKDDLLQRHIEPDLG